jgi:N-acetylneuraminate synthase
MQTKSIPIGNLQVGAGYPPVIVAELSGNHNQSLERALKLVEAAAEAGAQAVKLQTYTAETMTIDCREGDFLIGDPNSLWNGRTLYDLYHEAHTPWNWHEPIFRRCRELGIVCFSTPFDSSAVDLLESLDSPCYKIASFENTDLPLIRRVSATAKPVIISTGMASLAELEETIRTAREAGCRDLILLKCTSAYPAPPEAANLRTIPDLVERFDVQVGLSDHTLGLAVALTSVALGAVMIEKHFTLARADGGVDAAFSMEPEELRTLTSQSHEAWLALGEASYELTERERNSLKYRRSLYIVKNLKAGDKLTNDNVRAIRPGAGLAPKYLEEVLGRTVNRDARRGTPLSRDLID